MVQKPEGMWKQGGRSATLERAQAVLSSRRGRGTLNAPPPLTSSQELLSSHSGSSLSSVPAHKDLRPVAAHGPKPKSDPAPEVCRPSSTLNSGANRFLKKTVAAEAQSLPEKRASSLRASQTAVLGRLAQVENRFGKEAPKRSPSRVGHVAVQDAPEEQPGSERPRRFMKSRPQGAHSGNALLAQSDSSELSAPQLMSPIQEQTPTRLSPSPPELSPSPPELSPSPPELSPSPPELSPSPPGLSPSPAELSPSPPGPQSSSAGSARVDVHSLEELFPLDDASDTSELSPDLHINIMDIDELEPAALRLEQNAKKEVQVDLPEDSQEEPEEEEDYPSDFESVIQTESLSEPVPGSGQLPSPPCSEHVQEAARSPSPLRSELTQDSVRSPSPSCSEYSYSKTFTGTTSGTPVSDAPLPRPERPATKDNLGQTSHHAVHSVYSPSLQLLMQSLRQQLALTSQLISSSHEHHSRVLQNLGPPNYTYTTLQDTQQYIWKVKASMRLSKQLTEKR